MTEISVEKKTPFSLRKVLRKGFYKYALLCASHPLEVLAICALVVSFSAYPFLKNQKVVSEPSNSPSSTSFNLFVPGNDNERLTEDNIHFETNSKAFSGETLRLKRVILSTSEEALYGPGILTKEIMSNLFSVHEDIENIQVLIHGKPYSLKDICVKPVASNHGPSGNCLMYSPLLYWSMDEEKLAQDADLLLTMSKEKIETSQGVPLLQKSVLGNVQFGLDGALQGATSVIITYFVKDQGSEMMGEDISDLVWERVWDKIATKYAWMLKKDSYNSLTYSESARILYWEENTKSSDILALLTSDYVTILYVYFMFKKFRKLGSKYLLGSTGVFCLISGFIMAGGIFHIASIRVTFIVSEALPFLFVVFGLEHPYLYLKNVIQAGENRPSKKPNRRDIANALTRISGSVSYDVFMKASVLFLIGVYGTAGISQICLYGGAALVCGYFLFLTLFTSVLSLRFCYFSNEFTEEPKPSFEKFAQALNPYDFNDNDESPSPMIERVKLISIVAAVLSYVVNYVSSHGSYNHGHSDLNDLFNVAQFKNKRLQITAPIKMLISQSERGSDISEAILSLGRMIGPYVGFGKVMPEFVLESTLKDYLMGITVESLLHPLIFCLICFLCCKYIFWEEEEHEQEKLQNPSSRSQSYDSLSSIPSSHFEPITKGASSSSTASSCCAVFDDKLALEDFGSTRATTSRFSSPRDLDICFAIFNDPAEGPHLLSDDEILQLVVAKKIPAYNLEKQLKDFSRGIHIRRLLLQEQSCNYSFLDEVPFNGLDYSRVIGQCCENVVGYIPIPLGYVGPLLLDGRNVFIPMATTEGCLLASCHRGCKAVSMSGGASTTLTQDGMTRGPCLSFPSLQEAASFQRWTADPLNFGKIRQVFESTSRFAKLLDLKVTLAGRNAYCRFRTFTGDAMGMNMISKATEKTLVFLLEKFPNLQVVSLSGNYCTDKKPAAINWIEGRGKSVVCEAVIQHQVVQDVLKTTTSALVELNIKKNLVGSAMAGSIGGFNAHASNLVTAVFIACGQDPAQNVESSNCITLMEAVGPQNKDLLISCTMPSIEVGTVGGGTILPAQSACLQLLGVKGPNRDHPGENASNLARVVCAAVLAGELSLMAALAAGHLVKSHMEHNRHGKSDSTPLESCAKNK